MSDTPETDRYVKMRASLAYCIDRDTADFARRLERERDEARRKLDEHKIALESADKSNEDLGVMLEKAREDLCEAEKALQSERDLPNNLLDIDAICQQRDKARMERDLLAETLSDLWHYYSLTGAAYDVIEKALATVKEDEA